jgi:hypothetical protein
MSSSERAQRDSLVTDLASADAGKRQRAIGELRASYR